MSLELDKPFEPFEPLTSPLMARTQWGASSSHSDLGRTPMDHSYSSTLRPWALRRRIGVDIPYSDPRWNIHMSG